MYAHTFHLIFETVSKRHADLVGLKHSYTYLELKPSMALA